MKYSLLLLFLFGLDTIPAKAQGCNAVETYFYEVLCAGQSATCMPVERQIKRLQVAAVREKVWKAWKKANEKYAEEKIIPAKDFPDMQAGSFAIPESEEPSAVMPYYHGRKGVKPAAGYPFFLYLHGSGPKQAEWATGRLLCERFDDAPSLYFIPQIPNEGEYYRWGQPGKQWVWDKLLRQILLSDSVNADRLYIFGISEGGYGSQRLASFYADYWAAAGPMAGGEPLSNAPAENCGNLAFSLLTGSEDRGFCRNLLTRYTCEAFDSLQRVYPGAYVHRVELMPGYGHAIDYSHTTTWMKHYVRNPWPKEWRWEDFEMYGRHRRGFHNLLVISRPDSIFRTSYEMTIKGNHIEMNVRDVHYSTVQTDSVWGIGLRFARTYTPSVTGRFRLYLDEHLVDLGRPVTLVVNGVKVFEGKLRLDERNMQESLSCFYDPRRIYPAAIDVDLSLCR